MNPVDTHTFQVAETSAALMECITSDKKLYDAFYAARADHDGMVGMWTSCAFIAMAAQTSLAPLWAEESRDFIEDVHHLGIYMVYWQKSTRLIEVHEDAEELMREFITDNPTE